jgi:NADPH-dependent curcumin reductase CurA
LAFGAEKGIEDRYEALKNRQFRLKQHPTGRAESTDFDFVEAPVTTLGPGGALIQTLYLSIDPTNRIWMSNMEQYICRQSPSAT